MNTSGNDTPKVLCRAAIQLALCVLLFSCHKPEQRKIFLVEKWGTNNRYITSFINEKDIYDACLGISDGYSTELNRLLKDGWRVVSSREKTFSPDDSQSLRGLAKLNKMRELYNGAEPLTVECVGTEYIIER